MPILCEVPFGRFINVVDYVSILDFVLDCLTAMLGANYRLLILGLLFRGVPLHTTQGTFLEQCKENIVLGHRSREHMRSLISPLKDIVNVFFNGQLVP